MVYTLDCEFIKLERERRMLNQQHLQALVDGMSQQWQKERATTQLTLGQLIAQLQALPPHMPVAPLEAPHSYRGYYCDLAFEVRGEASRPAGELLAECRQAMGRVFTGYKGGDFMMGANTPLWIAEYGSSGERLLRLCDDGTIETAPEEEG